MQYEIAGFWRRVVAFFIDAIILGCFGLLLGLFFSQQFVELGGWGRAVGFPIAAIYFVILNSRIGGGQTIGKRVIEIQVVDKAGELLNLPKSTLRYSIIGVPYFLNNAMIPQLISYPVVFCLVSLLVFGFGTSIIYLLAFNRNTRQSLHDIIVGTYVIRKNVESSAAIKSVWSVHYAICGIIMVLALLIPMFIGQLNQNKIFSELVKTREQIQSNPQVVYATIQDGSTTFISDDKESKKSSFLSTNVIIKNQNVKNKKLASKIANIILDTHKEATETNLIQVVLTYGYDIGIASRWKSHRYSYDPQNWMKKND